MKEKYIKAFMDMAERFGKTSEAERLKVGCLLVKDFQVISAGINGQPPGWPTEACEDSEGNTLPTTRHAEDAALQKLWNSHETAEGSVVFCSHLPCLFCSIKLATAKVSHVYYRHTYRSDEGAEYLLSKGIGLTQVLEEQ